MNTPAKGVWPRWGQRGTAGPAIPARLTFDHITHAYGTLTAVSDLSLDVAPGEIVALLGRSGCGKTTLLRVAAGIERQSAGRVLLDREEVASAKVFRQPEERGIGYVFQDYALFPHLSVQDNVAFGLKNMARAEAREVALRALERVGLRHHAGDYPHELSGGEQQRVALARAIAPRPGVLLMDEPFSGLDRRLRDSVREETLAVLRETGATSLIVTHDPEEAMRMADRIALMDKGSLIQIGPPQELYRRPKTLFAARFFSEINELDGVVKSGVVETALGRAAAGGWPDGPAVVALRPSAILLGGPGRDGRIMGSRFLGDTDHLEIAVQGLDSPILARAQAGAWPEGSAVRVRFDEAQALVFPAAET
ncbi:iron ABC transporter ATP-binding protein [Terrihabitans soli]|uniref:Iron ABC transporter ATP-binding protein n=1 Tax=Terrihabitans soli TaxID=708113 RepID=A0A6S6QRY8_9HYPH|nr:ABC transporter ATP-binding protein [Terrihabitans soli]BCJ90707.1 iron ABC transporter ATP-binding protein [Terrihabitans soli]